MADVSMEMKHYHTQMKERDHPFHFETASFTNKPVKLAKANSILLPLTIGGFCCSSNDARVVRAAILSLCYEVCSFSLLRHSRNFFVESDTKFPSVYDAQAARLKEGFVERPQGATRFLQFPKSS